MATEIMTRDFKKTESVENYIESEVELALSDLLPPSDHYVLKVTAAETAHRNQNRKPFFECTVQVKLDSVDKVYRVRRQSSSFYESVQAAVAAMKRVLGRRHSLTKNFHKKSPVWAVSSGY